MDDNLAIARLEQQNTKQFFDSFNANSQRMFENNSRAIDQNRQDVEQVLRFRRAQRQDALSELESERRYFLNKRQDFRAQQDSNIRAKEAPYRLRNLQSQGQLQAAQIRAEQMRVRRLEEEMKFLPQEMDARSKEIESRGIVAEARASRMEALAALDRKRLELESVTSKQKSQFELLRIENEIEKKYQERDNLEHNRSMLPLHRDIAQRNKEAEMERVYAEANSAAIKANRESFEEHSKDIYLSIAQDAISKNNPKYYRDLKRKSEDLFDLYSGRQIGRNEIRKELEEFAERSQGQYKQKDDFSEEMYNMILADSGELGEANANRYKASKDPVYRQGQRSAIAFSLRNGSTVQRSKAFAKMSEIEPMLSRPYLNEFHSLDVELQTIEANLKEQTKGLKDGPAKRAISEIAVKKVEEIKRDRDRMIDAFSHGISLEELRQMQAREKAARDGLIPGGGNGVNSSDISDSVKAAIEAGNRVLESGRTSSSDDSALNAPMKESIDRGLGLSFPDEDGRGGSEIRDKFSSLMRDVSFEEANEKMTIFGGTDLSDKGVNMVKERAEKFVDWLEKSGNLKSFIIKNSGQKGDRYLLEMDGSTPVAYYNDHRFQKVVPHPNLYINSTKKAKTASQRNEIYKEAIKNMIFEKVHLAAKGR